MEPNPSIPSPTATAPARRTEIRFNESLSRPPLPVPADNAAEDEEVLKATQDVWSTPLKSADEITVATSTWRTARSRLSSLWSRSTGKQSLNGATWLYNLQTSLNSGFGAGGLRSAGYRGVREGRESGGYLPSEMGVGRTGKGPVAVPEAMIRALRQGAGIEQRKRKGITRKMDEDIQNRVSNHGTSEEEEARRQRRVLHEGLWLLQDIILLCERAGSDEVEVVQELKEIRQRFDGLLENMGVSHDQLMFTKLPHRQYLEDNLASVRHNRGLLKKMIEQTGFSERQFRIIMGILNDAWTLRQKIPGARDGAFRADPPPIWNDAAYRGWAFSSGGPIERDLVFTPSQEELEAYLEEEEKRSITLVSHMQLRTTKIDLEGHLSFLDELLDIGELHPSPFLQHAILLMAGAIQPEARGGWLLFWIVTSKAWRTAPVLKALRYGEMFQEIEETWERIVAKCPEAKFELEGRDVVKMHQRAMQHSGLSDDPRYRNFSEEQKDGPAKGQEWWYLEDVDTLQRRDIL